MVRSKNYSEQPYNVYININTIESQYISEVDILFLAFDKALFAGRCVGEHLLGLVVRD